MATQRLAYRALATCWSLANTEAGAAPEMARSLLGPDGEKEVNHALTVLSDAIHAGTKPAPLSYMPEFLGTEMQTLHNSLVYAGSHSAG